MVRDVLKGSMWIYILFAICLGFLFVSQNKAESESQKPAWLLTLQSINGEDKAEFILYLAFPFPPQFCNLMNVGTTGGSSGLLLKI